MESLLIITGSMGAGKSAVLAEASDILTLRHTVHAALDLDALGLAYLPSSVNNSLMFRNFRSLCRNYDSLSVKRLLLARAIEDRKELEWCRRAASSKNMVVCRLTASIETMQRRVETRESGIMREEYIARVAALNVILDRARVEDFTVINENRSLHEVAEEMLRKAGWISI